MEHLEIADFVDAFPVSAYSSRFGFKRTFRMTFQGGFNPVQNMRVSNFESPQLGVKNAMKAIFLLQHVKPFSVSGLLTKILRGWMNGVKGTL